MTLQQLFDKLLEDRKILLRLADKRAAENLRVSLVKKFSAYKVQMDALGFLDSDLEHKVVSMSWAAETAIAEFTIRERKVVGYSYQILEVAGAASRDDSAAQVSMQGGSNEQ